MHNRSEINKPACFIKVGEEGEGGGRGRGGEI